MFFKPEAMGPSTSSSPTCPYQSNIQSRYEICAVKLTVHNIQNTLNPDIYIELLLVVK